MCCEWFVNPAQSTGNHQKLQKSVSTKKLEHSATQHCLATTTTPCVIHLSVGHAPDISGCRTSSRQLVSKVAPWCVCTFPHACTTALRATTWTVAHARRCTIPSTQDRRRPLMPSRPSMQPTAFMWGQSSAGNILWHRPNNADERKRTILGFGAGWTVGYGLVLIGLFTAAAGVGSW